MRQVLGMALADRLKRLSSSFTSRPVGRALAIGLPLLLALNGTAPAAAAPLLLISIDGLRPGDILEAKQRGLVLPNLHRLVEQGSFATGVIGVLPSFTLPSHATLVTGVSPARHGITNNVQFWPAQQTAAQSYTFASSFKVPTLWDAAHAKGLGTATVNWPSTLASPGIDRAFSVFFAPATGQPDDALYLRQLNGPALIDELEARNGPLHLAPRKGADEEAEDARIAATLLQLHKPGLLSVHFGALDEAEHASGPGSAEAKQALERIDGYVGQLVAAHHAIFPDGVVAVVSDHGFTPIHTEINLVRAFIDEGLATADASGKITSWQAIPWPAAGVDAIYLARPDDAALKARVSALLDRLRADPKIGIERILDADEIARRGGFPGASFAVAFNLDTTGPVRPTSQPLIAPARQKGTHGHLLDHPELQSAFLLAGPGVPRGKALGVIDMRAIAPTLAAILGVDLPDAERPPLALIEGKSGS